jgi:hypothetical protein
MSFDTTGEAGGTVFDDEDVLRFDGTAWTIEFDGSAANSNWAVADLDAVMVPEPSVGWKLITGAAVLGRVGIGDLTCVFSTAGKY